MQFNGPEANDFDNIRSLNRGFLSLTVAEAGAVQPPSVAGSRMPSLSPRQRERLANAPFLLFSLRERDHQYWEDLLARGTDGDLFSVMPAPDDRYAKLVCASLGFVWQLSQRNPYTARLVFGASQYWCDLISELTLYRLLQLAAANTDIVTLRQPANDELWTILLNGGVSQHRRTREASHIAAFQALLTNAVCPGDTSWGLAARTRKRPRRLKVADRDRKR